MTNQINFIDELQYCNPRFPIVFVTYGNDFVKGNEDYTYSLDFDNYGVYKDYMDEYLKEIYNWDLLNDIQKDEIIRLRCRRIRFLTYQIKYSQFSDLANFGQKEEKKFIYLDEDNVCEIGMTKNGKDSFIQGYKVAVGRKKIESSQTSNIDDDFLDCLNNLTQHPKVFENEKGNEEEKKRTSIYNIISFILYSRSTLIV